MLKVNHKISTSWGGAQSSQMKHCGGSPQQKIQFSFGLNLVTKASLLLNTHSPAWKQVGLFFGLYPSERVSKWPKVGRTQDRRVMTGVTRSPEKDIQPALNRAIPNTQRSFDEICFPVNQAGLQRLLQVAAQTLRIVLQDMEADKGVPYEVGRCTGKGNYA